MAIRSKGNSFVLDVTIENKRQRINFVTQKEAELAEAKLNYAILAGENVGELLSSWRKRKAVLNGTPNRNATLKDIFETTYKRYWQGIAYERTALINAHSVLAFLGDNTPIKDIQQSDIDRLIDHLKTRRNSNATINRKLSALSKILSTALDRGYILRKPKIEKLKESQGRVRFLSDKEELNLLITLQSIEYGDVADFARCLIDTGCRVSELLRLTKEDMNGDILTLWITKNNQARSIPMTKRVKSILLRLTENQQMPFSNLDASRIRSGWDRAKKMMRLEDDKQFVPHCLRHTCASRLVQRGIPLTTVKEWLGHKSIQVTMRYSHLSPQNLVDAVKVLELPEYSTFEAVAGS